MILAIRITKFSCKFGISINFFQKLPITEITNQRETKELEILVQLETHTVYECELNYKVYVCLTQWMNVFTLCWVPNAALIKNKLKDTVKAKSLDTPSHSMRFLLFS